MLFISLFISFTEARELLIGGNNNAWKIPSSKSESLNKWAEASRFQIGDSLDYDSCSTSSPIAVYKDGNTKVKLDKSGPFYFISGAEGQCEKGQKLVIVVLSGRHGFFHVSPAPSPVEFEGLAMALTSGGTSLKGRFMVIFGVLVGLLLF
ncbi:hypothetical protein SO802_020889 [Lithocarpus litseifolius]|uniref:Phytocyanin domain-containing protein n=1 Tax=Lithocarpus litseifolius TaxID=425828 RepID=A0AAW2CDU3_9ROSI